MDQGRVAPSPVCCDPGRFLDKRDFTRIILRKEPAFRYPTSSGSRGAARPPLFLDQTEARRVEKIFENPHPSSPSLSQSLE